MAHIKQHECGPSSHWIYSACIRPFLSTDLWISSTWKAANWLYLFTRLIGHWASTRTHYLSHHVNVSSLGKDMRHIDSRSEFFFSGNRGWSPAGKSWCSGNRVPPGQGIIFFLIGTSRWHAANVLKFKFWAYVYKLSAQEKYTYMGTNVRMHFGLLVIWASAGEVKEYPSMKIMFRTEARVIINCFTELPFLNVY